MNTSLTKQKPIRDKKYVDWIRSLDCIICQYPAPSDPHHTMTGGKATKADDTTCIPLCHKHHCEVHQIGKKTFAEKYNLNYGSITARLNLIYGVDNNE